MSTLRSSLFEAINRLQPELSPSAQAQLTIPMGVVQQRRQAFEDRIRQHRHEPNYILIERALRNTDELIRQDRTYADQLRLAEAIGLRSLPPYLRDFLRDHDNLHRATVRSRLFADTAATNTAIDIFARVEVRIIHLRNVYSLNIIRETRSQAERIRMRKDPALMKEMHDCTDVLVDEIYRVLHRYEQLQALLPEETELENVGPDHNVNDFGSDISPAPSYTTTLAGLFETEDDKLDHTQRCCICLDPYTDHPAFKLSLCNHVIGKTCLVTWLNGTARNANCCPFCRAELCTRRARQVSSRTIALQTEEEELNTCFARALGLMHGLDHLANQIYGDDAEATRGAWTGDAVVEINRRCFENGVNFGFTKDVRQSLGWRLRRIEWARGGVLVA